MLARALLENHYGDFEALTLAIADVLAAQVGEANRNRANASPLQ